MHKRLGNKRGAVIVLDPKGDRELLVRSKAEAHAHGKPFALFAPAFLDHSVTMNPLATATDALEVGHRIQALIPPSSEEVFREFPLALIMRLAEAQQALGIPWTLQGLYRVSVFRRRMEALIYDYLVHLGYYRPGTLAHVIQEYTRQGGNDLTADALIEDPLWPAEHYRKMTTSLVPTFRGVVGGRLGPLLSPPPGQGLTWHRIVEEGMVVYFALASMLIGDVANRIGRIILQDLVGYIGRRFAYEDPATMRPITVFVDDFGDVVYPEFIDALNKARGANVRFIVAMQSRADPEATLGRETARRVMDNLGSRLICGLADDETAAALTKDLTATVELPTAGVGLGYAGVGGLTGHTQRTHSPQSVPLIRAAWLTALPIGEGFCRIGGVWWKLRMPLLTPVSQALRDALGLTAMWAAMDPTNVHTGEVWRPKDTPRPPVPPTRWLSPPVSPSLPSSAAVMLPEGKSTKRTSPSCRKALHGVRSWWHALVRRPPRS